jgi:hypothetical protein
MHALCTRASANQIFQIDPFPLDLTLLGQQMDPFGVSQLFCQRLQPASGLRQFMVCEKGYELGNAF